MRFKYLISFGLILTSLLVIKDRLEMNKQISLQNDLTTISMASAKSKKLTTRIAKGASKVKKPKPIAEVTGESEEIKMLAQKLDNLNLNITLKGRAGESEINECKANIYKTFAKFSPDYLKTLKSLVLSFDSTDRRGLSSSQRMKLRCVDVDKPELSAVMIHELGHIQDLGLMQGQKKSGTSEFKDGEYPIYNDDPSLEFYRISWKNEVTPKSTSSLDFISTYGKTDSFEEFAEIFTVYRLQGPYFRELIKYNDILGQKYEFMKNKVFAGQEFDLDQTVTSVNFLERNYDATVMNYDWERFMGKS